ncbi:MAG: beta-glucosidase, partial [Acidimicrobiia bacterium]|nr:beta-glucosidase [Acidimicrobiia bacterium]
MSDRVDELLEQLTLEEKCGLVVGQTAWIVSGCERLGIPDWTVSDGPVGVRGRAMGPGLVVPGPSALAATWDVELVDDIGRALGEECSDKHVQLLLAPTVNIHRVPVGGRHFECYSEDPELTSRVAVAYIDGVQSQGVGACIKHFVANDQEYERHEVDIRVDERALREIYLPPFEAAVKEAGVRSVMGAYNYVNGSHACAHDELLIDLLKGEWGFDGFVVSDWGAVKDTIQSGNGGLDLEMPSPGRFWGQGKLAAAVERGDVAEAAVDDKVRRLLEFLEWCGELGEDTDHTEHPTERPEARALARRAGAESTVLIHDRVGLLPLDPARLSSVALIGPGVAETAM